MPAHDRRRLERLCRYVARPPLANERLAELPDGNLVLRLKTRWRDGTTHLLLAPSELFDRLVPLIPPPRAHQLRYHGILAPCASRRDQVVPIPPAARTTAGARLAAERFGQGGRVSSDEPHGIEKDPGQAPPGDRTEQTHFAPRAAAPASAAARAGPVVSARDSAANGVTRHRYRWAELLQRVFEIDALRCPRCGSTLRLIAAIEDPPIARKILEHLKLPARAPPLEPARAVALPPEPAAPDVEAAWDFDQRPAHEPSEPR